MTGAFVFAGLSALYAFLNMFMGFQRYDDDGILMVCIRSLLQGHKLYDQIFTPYGPFYYLVQETIYSVLRAPVSHDVMRTISATIWIVCTIAGSWAIYRLTRSFVFAVVAWLMTLTMLWYFPLSAGHPEELGILLTVMMAGMACSLNPRHATRSMLATGAVVAFLALTKINLGVFAFLATGMVLSKSLTNVLWRRILFGLLAVAGLFLPLALMAPLLSHGLMIKYFIQSTLSIFALILIMSQQKSRAFIRPQNIVIFALGFVGAGFLVLTPFLAQGTSLGAVLNNLVLLPKQMTHDWWLNAPVTRRSCAEAIASAAVAFLFTRPRFQSWVLEKRLIEFQSIRASLGIMCLLGPFCFQHGGVKELMAWGPPFAWLLVVSVDRNEDSTRIWFGKATLCCLTVLGNLYAFAVAGLQQLGFVAILVELSGLVLLWDALRILRSELGPGFNLSFIQPHRVRWMGRVVIGAAVMVLCAEVGASSYAFRKFVPLGLPGARLLHVSPEAAVRYRSITSELNGCPSFYTVPGLLSFYLWTQQDVPSLINANDPLVLNDLMQNQIMGDLSRHTGMCVLYNGSILNQYLRGQDPSKEPLMKYIKTRFEPVTSIGSFYILKERSAAAYSSSVARQKEAQ